MGGEMAHFHILAGGSRALPMARKHRPDANFLFSLPIKRFGIALFSASSEGNSQWEQLTASGPAADIILEEAKEIHLYQNSIQQPTC